MAWQNSAKFYGVAEYGRLRQIAVSWLGLIGGRAQGIAGWSYDATLVKQYLYIGGNYKRRVASVGNEASGRHVSPRH